MAPRPPVWGDRPPDRYNKAAEEDRKQRQAHGWTRMRSPYLSLIRLPGEVSPGDRTQAREILARIESTLAIKGRWTPAERGRLRQMRDKWEQRAEGQDTFFNLRGWRQDQGRRPYKRGEWEREQADRKFSTAMDKIRHEIGQKRDAA